MKFVVSSTELLSHLQAISRVISNKSTLPILDNFLFDLKDNKLVLTASDLEVTMVTSLDLENSDGEGIIALPSRILLETLKKFPEQPLNFDINMDNYGVSIITEKGKFSVVGQNGEDFPELPNLDGDKSSSLQVSVDLLQMGINKTLFATADDELRPVMNGILVELSPENMTFVASDSHKLVRYRRMDAKTDFEASFILPKKPAGLLKNVLPKETGDVVVEFDDKNAFFTLPNYKLVCRLVEGNYPSYNAVIPQDNPYKVIIDRSEFHNTLGRVSIFSNQASNLVKLKMANNELTVSAQDIDFSISAYERISCQYEGDEMEIGFKSGFLADILDNLNSTDVILELSDPSRAGILLPFENGENEDELMLLMPMMINV
ncbi:DNA polymerase III subunit beta [Carboxylicivirga caseinilyticus]|uniref:DNA polymerase III subunit beta n=1 Tax=Carboxylicivirga caseinilyticus TaxID=3417572 RepID=UPI002AA858F7|nr:DNA polymerase III subunit beta [uncultured Carboxylicivirga sp.]MCU4165050.1 DNA polymerase III subunit beta [Marinilabiliaceae bacterium A049]